jgi:hypothetical protein
MLLLSFIVMILKKYLAVPARGSSSCNSSSHTYLADSKAVLLPLRLPASSLQAAHHTDRSLHHSRSSDMSGPSTPTASTPLPSSHSAKLAVLHSTWSLQDKQSDCQQEYLNELQLYSVLGRGGFSTVYAGTWHGSRTAIKVGLAVTRKRCYCSRLACMCCRQ